MSSPAPGWTSGSSRRESDLQFDAVLAAAQLGQDAAVAVLYRQFNPALVRYLGAGDSTVAEDLAAEVWLAAAPKLPAFSGGEAEFRAWLFTIARRRLIDHGRRVARQRTRSAGAASQMDRAVGPDPGDLVTDSLSAQAAVDRLIAGLPSAQAEVVLLRVVAGFDVTEVAAIMGRSPGWVRVSQHRALRRLARSAVAEEQVTP
jgi:RNA polymerase sigma-70 factor (ECF subfamily)